MSAPRRSATERQRLTKRAHYFFATSFRSRDEVARFATDLLAMGPVVAIGGFLRDIYLGGNRKFTSDVDFVVDPACMAEFERFARTRGARVNRFGGYGMTLDRWKVDVWPLQRTWAAVNGHVEVRRLEDLVDATFFDWDAVLYSVAERRVITPAGYFDRLRERVLDVNLRPNPNPLGNAVRALRYAYRWDAKLGRRLAQHVIEQVREHGWDGFKQSERKSFPRPLLHAFDGELLCRVMSEFERSEGMSVRLPLSPMQQELPFHSRVRYDQDLWPSTVMDEFARESLRMPFSAERAN